MKRTMAGVVTESLVTNVRSQHDGWQVPEVEGSRNIRSGENEQVQDVADLAESQIRNVGYRQEASGDCVDLSTGV